jgi:hypothetical protein
VVIRRRLLPVAGLALASLAACEPELSLQAALEGRACRASAPRCLPDFVCNTSNVCVPSAAPGGAGGSGNLEDNPGGGGSSGSGAGGANAAGGTGPDVIAIGQGGSAGSPLLEDPPDAGDQRTHADAAAPADAGGCVPGPLYQDLDNDGFGGLAVQAVGCSGNGLVTTPGDCFDATPTLNNLADQVHPGQTEYFYVGYPNANKPDGISFDFDCSDSEDRHPDYAAAAPNCEELDGSECAGSGYEPYPQRAGVAGVEAICGSEFIVTCTPSGPAPCNSERALTDAVYLCR